jgi:hypothetical protein
LITRKQQEEQTKVIDVFGQQTEPICNYHTYHHKFSLHSIGTVCVGAIIHKIILQEYRYYYYYRHKPTIKNNYRMYAELGALIPLLLIIQYSSGSEYTKPT